MQCCNCSEQQFEPTFIDRDHKQSKEFDSGINGLTDKFEFQFTLINLHKFQHYNIS